MSPNHFVSRMRFKKQEALLWQRQGFLFLFQLSCGRSQSASVSNSLP